MNLRSILKTIASFALLLAALAIYDCLITEADAARNAAGLPPSELARLGGPIGVSRAGSDGGPIGKLPRRDGGPIGKQARSDGGPIG